MRKEWWLLLLAGVLEVVWVSGLKYAATWWEWVITISIILLSFKVFIEAAARLPLGTVYVIFTGLGTAGTVIVEILIFDEPAKPLKLMFIALMAAGVLGLKLATKDEDSNEQAGEA
ncbi:QacE family quaternary ammonium compound efflux SMR transporter [Paenibacillaceae bacterium]|nr:QacE family quaternary ammonium compound efflux SMR transporter [Paenibacillaceae bacterium]